MSLPALGMKTWKTQFENWLFVSHGSDGTLKTTTVTDCNSALTNGWYACNPGTANAPTASYLHLQMLTMNVNNARQVAYDYATDATWMRKLKDGAWQAWEQTWPVASSSSGLLSAQPAASTAPGGFYYATDQDVLYLSNGTVWQRQGLPAGATTTVYSATVPNGWVAYDGSTLPSSVGIYAALYAALGNTTTKPDTRGRSIVHIGTHADVSALGNNEGQQATVANRTPKHNSTNGVTAINNVTAGHNLSLPDHGHASGAPTVPLPSWYVSDGAGPGGSTWYWKFDTDAGGWHNYNFNLNGVSAPPIYGATSFPAINGGVQIGGSVGIGGSIGPGGTRPIDAPAYVVFSVVLAKL